MYLFLAFCGKFTNIPLYYTYNEVGIIYTQEEQATWSIYIQLSEIPLSILMNLILSSYCDTVGHKLPLVLPTVGSALASLILAVLATPSLLAVPIPVCFVYSVVHSAFGGYSMVSIIQPYITAATSYILIS